MGDLLQALEDAKKRFAVIVEFADPYEINEEPEEFGGTDDGLETVCMVYENMQRIAQIGLAKIEEALRSHHMSREG